jgi:hypothetical protein
MPQPSNLGIADVSAPARVKFPLRLPLGDSADPGTNGRDLNAAGEWSSGTNYDELDLVSYTPDGNSWTARIPNIGVTPGTDANTWQLNSARGIQGIQGETGVGTPGANGLDGYRPTIDVTSVEYGAVGDGVTDDTEAFQAAFADAETDAALIGYAMVLIPPTKKYLVGDPSIADVPSLTVPSAPLYFSPDARNIDVWGYGAIIKLSDFGVSNSVLRIFGSNIRIFGLTINLQCADATLALKGCSGFEVNGYPDIGVNGVDVEFIDCRAVGGFFSQDAANQGQEHFLGVNCTRAKWINCWSIDSGWQAFRTAGYDEELTGCTALNQRGNGFRVNDGTEITLTNCRSSSSRDSGRSGFLIDPGSASTYPAKRRTRVYLNNCFGYSSANDPNESGCSLLKLAATDEVIVTGGAYIAEHGRTVSPNTTLRLEDNLRKVTLNNVYVQGVMLFTPDQFDGAVSAHANGYDTSGTSGFAQFTLPAGHGITSGDTIFIQDSSINAYNRPHVISSYGTTKYKDHPSDSSLDNAFVSITNNGSGFCLFTVAGGHNAVVGDTLTVSGSGTGAYNTTHTVTAITGTTITTNRSYVADSTSNTLQFSNSVIRVTSEVAYTAGSIGSAYAHQGVDEVRFRNVAIKNTAGASYLVSNFIIENVHCRIFDLENVDLEFTETRTVKRACIGWETKDVMLDMFRMKNVKMVGDTTNILKGVQLIRACEGTDEQQRVTVINNGGTPGGSFTLTLSGFGTTPSISWDADTDVLKSNMQTQLRTLTGLSSVSVTYISGNYTTGAIFNVDFRGTLGNLSQMTSTDSMTGSVHSLAHSTPTQGVLSPALVTSGKTICLNSGIVNRGSGTTVFISPYQSNDFGSPYADRAILFASIADDFGAYKAAAVPSSLAVGWNQGDVIRNSAPTAGSRPAWHAIATTAAGVAPSFQQEAALS